MNIMEFNADGIDNDKILLLLLLIFQYLRNKCWWNPREDDLKQMVEKFAIRCINCGKEKMIDVDILDTTYQEIITNFV